MLDFVDACGLAGCGARSVSSGSESGRGSGNDAEGALRLSRESMAGVRTGS